MPHNNGVEHFMTLLCGSVRLPIDDIASHSYPFGSDKWAIVNRNQCWSAEEKASEQLAPPRDGSPSQRVES